ncbi:hypothetical protein K7432_012002 [Basidiobolus ranarum]|uniref:HIT-type domain-containing protein n=1 Tax=Basidiobolus ranarum TaxID=34480 RepID=A0ABR2VT15_9FUNG
METTKDLPVCGICHIQFSKYICPRCNLRYCSLNCYRNEAHLSCTENFYREQIVEEVQNRSVSTSQKLQTMKMLAEFEKKNLASEEELETEDVEEVGLEDKLLSRFEDMNIETATPDDLWELLTEEERADFINTLDANEESTNALIDMAEPWRPWWIQSKQYELVSEVGEADNEEMPQIPKVVDNIESISVLSPKPPRKEMIYNLVNIIFAYVYAVRYLDGDLKHSSADAGSLIWSVSSLLDSKEPFVFESLEDSIVTSMQRSIKNTQLKQPMGYQILVLHDIVTIFSRIDFVLAALSELYALFQDIQQLDKSFGKTIMRKAFMSEKKTYFYLSFAKSLTEKKYTPTLNSLAQELSLHITLMRKENELHENDKEKIESYLEKQKKTSQLMIEELD